jgi:hypothetical protein
MKLRRPSPALVIACLALFVALGGTVLAATKIDGRTIRVKSLPGNRLTVGSLPGNRLQAGTIPGRSLAPGSVKAEQIDVGSLGTVPSAAHADSADNARHAQTAIAAEQASDATTINGRGVGCTANAREYAGACWDLVPSQVALTAPDAVDACAAVGGELPSGLALLEFGALPGVAIHIEGEWTNQVFENSEIVHDVYVLTSEGHFIVRLPSEPHHFRCVTPLVH